MLSLNLNEKGDKRGKEKKNLFHTVETPDTQSPLEILIFLRDEMCYLVREQDQHPIGPAGYSSVLKSQGRTELKGHGFSGGDLQPGHMAVQSRNGSLSHLKTNSGPQGLQGPFQGQKSFGLTWNFHE